MSTTADHCPVEVLMNTLPNLDELSTTELISGLLIQLGAQKFSEQSLYRFLRKLESDFPTLADRLRILGPEERLRSDPVRRVLNYLEMGKVLEVAMPNPVDQFFRPRATQLESVRHQLVERGVLPAHEETFKELAGEFRRFSTTAKQ